MSMAVEPSWETLLGEPVQSERLASCGRNSRIYRLTTEDGRILAGKTYFSNPGDTRNRHLAETVGLTLASARGLDVPGVLAGSEASGALVLEFVDGAPVGEADTSDIEAAASFLSTLWVMSGDVEVDSVPLASEACFCGKDVHDNLLVRLGRLQDADGPEPEYEAFREYVDQFTRVLQDKVEAGKGLANESWAVPIGQEARTLSPSDFGFHNALRRPDGTVCFLDFEYFGWDDPAKMICDFVLHPAMSLGDDLANVFVEKMMQTMGSEELSLRLRGYYPLLTLKWCCIFLNEFVACDSKRREFAGRTPSGEVLVRQLGKAQDYLENIDERYERFSSRLA